MTLPRRKRGAQSEEQQREYYQKVQDFSEHINQIRSTLDLTPGSREWCYILEQAGVIDKSEFDDCQILITECRKDGHLPLDIIAEDEGRAFKNDEFIHEANPKKAAKYRVNYLLKKWDYTPISFWENQDYYVQMLVEKLGLRNLFSPICAIAHLRIASGSGWSDLNSRADIMRHFKEWEEKGKIPIL